MEVKEVSGLDMAFGCGAMKLMPPMDKIPKEFKYGSNKWCKLTSDWFFAGLKLLNITPKKGIDKSKALKHIKAILASFEPQHEHKEAAVAYLLSEWFEDDVKWEAAPFKK